MEHGEARDLILGEASRCLYCGFCEAACPTLRHGLHRGYGPRGRVLVAAMVAGEGRATVEVVAALYSCLLCSRCQAYCPAGIDVPMLVRAARSLLVALDWAGAGDAVVAARGDPGG